MINWNINEWLSLHKNARWKSYKLPGFSFSLYEIRETCLFMLIDDCCQVLGCVRWDFSMHISFILRFESRFFISMKSYMTKQDLERKLMETPCFLFLNCILFIEFLSIFTKKTKKNRRLNWKQVIRGKLHLNILFSTLSLYTKQNNYKNASKPE